MQLMITFEDERSCNQFYSATDLLNLSEAH